MKGSEERSEQPTAKRRKDAFKKGQSPRSVELVQGITLALAVFMLPTVVPGIARKMAEDWQVTIASASSAEPGPALGLLGRLFADSFVALSPLLAVLSIGALVAGTANAGRPNIYKLKPQWKTMNPGSGLKRLFSSTSVVNLAKEMFKLGLLGFITWTLWEGALRDLLYGPAPFQRLVESVGRSTAQLLQYAALIGIAVGLADAAWMRRKNNEQLRMTKQEVREESKQTEGNSQVKGEIRRRQMKLSRTRMLSQVMSADVVITNPTHLAIALAYQPGSFAPVCVAKGAGVVAQRIRDEARRHGVPIRENKPLARTLFRSVDVGDTIPVTLYRAVAEVLAAVYRARSVAPRYVA